MPIIELVSFPCSEGFINDRATVLGPAIEPSLQIPGFIRAHHALQIEKGDQEIGYLATVWESYEDHKKIINSIPDRDELVQTVLGPALAGKQEVRHVDNFTGGNPEDPLAAPVTEIVTARLKEGGSMDDLNENIQKLGEILRKAPSCHGVVWGRCIEHPDTPIGLLGWDSVEAHYAAAKEEEASSAVRGLFEKADVQLKHASFVKYPAWIK